jgi:hypothetical protein
VLAVIEAGVGRSLWRLDPNARRWALKLCIIHAILLALWSWFIIDGVRSALYVVPPTELELLRYSLLWLLKSAAVPLIISLVGIYLFGFNKSVKALFTK